jgi:hypothetical protein
LKIRLPSQKCFLTRKADDEAFADEQELQDFLSLLMRHWNRVGRKLEADDVFTPLLFEDEKGKCCDFVVESKIGVDDWKFRSSPRTDRE